MTYIIVGITAGNPALIRIKATVRQSCYLRDYIVRTSRNFIREAGDIDFPVRTDILAYFNRLQIHYL